MIPSSLPQFLLSLLLRKVAVGYPFLQVSQDFYREQL